MLNKMNDENGKAILILGGCGFIGSHLAKRLKKDHFVVIADKKSPKYFRTQDICDSIYLVDLTDFRNYAELFSTRPIDTVYHLAADFGGMGYIQSNSSFITLTNTQISLNVIKACIQFKVQRIFFSSSACVYPQDLQDNMVYLQESDAWPADPQDGYGLEKLFTEKILAYAKAERYLNIRIGRFHSIYGEKTDWFDGREKVLAAIARKVLCYNELLKVGISSEVELWGDGQQVRSFLHISDCLEAIVKLTESDYADPLNIGSSVGYSIKEVFDIVSDIVGVKEPRIKYNKCGPLGVACRSSDNTKVEKILAGWKPVVDLDSGLRRLVSFIKSDMDASRKFYSDQSWIEFVTGGLSSSYIGSKPSRDLFKFAILIPITSRNDSTLVLERLDTLLLSFKKTVSVPSQRDYSFYFYFGVDFGDDFLNETTDLIDFVNRALEPLRISARVFKYKFAPGSICKLWSSLALEAYKVNCDFYLLLGDDIVIEGKGWPDEVVDAFISISIDRGLPFGVGCVCLYDRSFPGFPSFPVLHRTHIDIFHQFGPRKFINQELDPYFFQLYRTFGASRMAARNSSLVNLIGGSNTARYNKVSVEWDTTDAIEVEAYLTARGYEGKRLITLDVIIPSYRGSLEYLTRLVDLKAPECISLGFIIIFDNPEDKTSVSTKAHLERRFAKDPFVRIRMNNSNLGASMTRNRGLAESKSDHVLFLDDDVIPTPDLIFHYAKAMRDFPGAAGFIGPSILPAAVTIGQKAVISANITHFWSMALLHPDSTALPWGITANLLTRKTRVRFSSVYELGGGGEDIEYCREVLSVLDNKSGFVSVPLARVDHPWWDSGAPKTSHFMNWAIGDGHLQVLYPQYCYYSLPNLAELILFVILLAPFMTSTAALLTLVSFPIISFASDCSVQYFQAKNEYELLVVIRGVWIVTLMEIARLYGHLKRGELNCVTRRFNWFVDFWSGAVDLEQRRYAWLWVCRLFAHSLFVALLIYS